MSSTPRSVGSERRVSFAVRLEEIEPEQINAVILSPMSDIISGDDENLNSPQATATSPAEFSPSKMDASSSSSSWSSEEETVIPTSLSQIKHEAELVLPKLSNVEDGRGPWSMTCFIDNLCAPEVRGAESMVASPVHRTDREALDSEEDKFDSDQQPPSSPFTTGESGVAAIGEDAFLPDADEDFLPPGEDEAFLPPAADESFLDAAFLPPQDESAFLPPFQDDAEEKLDNVATIETEQDVEEQVGEPREQPTNQDPASAVVHHSEDSTATAEPDPIMMEPENQLEVDVDNTNADENAEMVDQQATIVQQENLAEVEVEIKNPDDDKEESVEITNDQGTVEAVSTETQGERDDQHEQEMEVEVETTNNQEVGTTECEPSTTQQSTGDLEESEDHQAIITQQGNEGVAKDDIKDEEAIDTPSTPEKDPTAGKDHAVVDGETDCMAHQSSQEPEQECTNVSAQEKIKNNHSINMEYTYSINTEFITDHDEDASAENNDDIIEELRILLMKSQDEKQKAVQDAVQDTEMRLRQDSMTEEAMITRATKSEHNPEPRSFARVQLEQEEQVEEEREQDVMKIAGAMNVASVIQNQLPADEDLGEINTLKNSLGSLLKNQKETIESLQASLVERDRTIEELAAEGSSSKDKQKTTQSSLSFAEKALISLKAGKIESKATIENLKSSLREGEQAIKLAKQEHASEQEQSTTTIATLQESLVEKEEALACADAQTNAQLLIIEEQKETIESLQLSLQEADNSIDQAKADTAKVEERLKDSIDLANEAAAKVQEEQRESMEQGKADSEKAQEELKASVEALQQENQEMRSLINDQSNDIMARESTIFDLKDQVERLEASLLRQGKTDEELLKENQRLKCLLEQQQLDFATKERSLEEMKQEVRGLVESVQEACNVRKELETEHEKNMFVMNEKVRSLSQDCESLKSIVSLQSKGSEYLSLADSEDSGELAGDDGKAPTADIEIPGSPSSVISSEGPKETATEGNDCNSEKKEEEIPLKKKSPDETARVRATTEPNNDHPSEETEVEALANKSGYNPDEAVDPMFCPVASDLLENEEEIKTIPSQKCREQLQKMDSTRPSEEGKLLFNKKILSLTCGCVTASYFPPDAEILSVTNSIVDTDDDVQSETEAAYRTESSFRGTEMSNALGDSKKEYSLETGANATWPVVKPTPSSDSSRDGQPMADVVIEGDEDAGLNEIEAVLNLSACNIQEDLSLMKSKTSSSDISSKESRDLGNNSSVSTELADYVDGDKVIPMTKKLEALSGELMTTILSDTRKDCPELKESALEDKVGIFKVAFRAFQGEKEKLLKEAEAEKKSAIEEMRAQLEEEKRAFIEAQEKLFGKSAKRSPVRRSKAKSPARQTTIKSPVRQTKSKSPVRRTNSQCKDSATNERQPQIAARKVTTASSSVIEKAKASLKKTSTFSRQKNQTIKPKPAPRVPLYLRSSGGAPKSQKILKPVAKSSARSAAVRSSSSVPKVPPRKPSSIRAPSPTSRTSSIRAPSPSSRTSSIRAPSPTSRVSSIRAPSPTSRLGSSIRAPSPTGLRGPTPRSSINKAKVNGNVRTTTARTSGKVAARYQTTRPCQQNIGLQASKIGPLQAGRASKLPGPSSSFRTTREKLDTNKSPQKLSCEVDSASDITFVQESNVGRGSESPKDKGPTVAMSALENSFASLMRTRDCMTPSSKAAKSPRFLLADPQEKITQDHDNQSIASLPDVQEKVSSDGDLKPSEDVDIKENETQVNAEPIQGNADCVNPVAELSSAEKSSDVAGEGVESAAEPSVEESSEECSSSDVKDASVEIVATENSSKSSADFKVEDEEPDIETARPEEHSSESCNNSKCEQEEPATEKANLEEHRLASCNNSKSEEEELAVETARLEQHSSEDSKNEDEEPAAEVTRSYDASAHQETRSSVPELDLLNAEISNSDSDLEIESDDSHIDSDTEEDTVLDPVAKELSRDSESEVAGDAVACSFEVEVREEIQSLRGDDGACRESEEGGEKRSEIAPGVMSNSFVAEEDFEELRSVSPPKTIRRSTRLAKQIGDV